MTRTTNARLAGFFFLFYIATGIGSMVLMGQVLSGSEGPAARLASLAAHASLVRVNILLTLLQALDALVLGVALYGLTREADHDLAVLALSFRIAEGALNAVATIRSIGLLSLAGAIAASEVPDVAAATALGDFLLGAGGWTGLVSASCFAVGSTIFCGLFLRARSIPVWMSWLGLGASILLAVLLPAQLAGYASGLVTDLMWLPMLVFEVALGLWLIVRGAAVPAPAR